ncbi:MAG TPA: HmuY family protein, partial [Hanamia sp.]|nr:HmuY family protein [Hanamia sp.]
MKSLKLSMLALAAVVIGLVSCTKDDVPNPAPTPAVSVTDSIEIPFATNNFTLYSFKDSAVVSNNDSATTKWDIGIRLVSIIVNSHASGPGNAGVITQSGIYDAFKIAPENGYAYDTTTSKTAIDAGFTTGWYNYDDATHAFS